MKAKAPVSQYTSGTVEALSPLIHHELEDAGYLNDMFR